MAATNQNFTKWKGDDFVLRFTIQDSLNIEPFKALWILATEVGGTRKIVKTTAGHFSEQGGISMVGNRVEIPILSVETDSTSGLDAGTYYHELHMEDGEGRITMAAVGGFTLVEPEEKRGI